jgi:hypothetical protein
MNTKTQLSLILLLITGAFYTHAQTTIEQNETFVNYLNEKKSLGASQTFKYQYKIQIFSGDIENTRKIITQAKNEFNELDIIVEFNAPLYKVWVGSFMNRIDAERILKDIQMNYPHAFIIKPSK